MIIKQNSIQAEGIRLSIAIENNEVGHAYLYIMENDLHDEPFGLLEDVFVNEAERGKGAGKILIKKIISLAQKNGCYKLIATSRDSRPKVHELYKSFKFKNYGREFRLDL